MSEEELHELKITDKEFEVIAILMSFHLDDSVEDWKDRGLLEAVVSLSNKMEDIYNQRMAGNEEAVA